MRAQSTCTVQGGSPFYSLPHDRGPPPEHGGTARSGGEGRREGKEERKGEKYGGEGGGNREGEKGGEGSKREGVQSDTQ